MVYEGETKVVDFNFFDVEDLIRVYLLFSFLLDSEDSAEVLKSLDFSVCENVFQDEIHLSIADKCTFDAY